jgi:hypothetical protein
MKKFLLYWAPSSTYIPSRLGISSYPVYLKQKLDFISETLYSFYYQVYEWLHTGFELVIGFILLFDTARDYTLLFTITHTLVSTVT